MTAGDAGQPRKAAARKTTSKKASPAPGNPLALTSADNPEGEGVKGERHEIAGDAYFQTPEKLWAIGGERGAMLLLDGQLAVTAARHIRDVTPEQTPGSVLDSMIEATYTDPAGLTVPFAITGADEQETRPQWPRQSGVSMVTAKRKVPYIGNAVRAMAATWRREHGGWQQAYACTGLLLTPDGPRFLRIGAPALTPDGFDPSVVVHLPIGVDRRLAHLGLDDPSTPEQFPDDFAALLRVLDTAPGEPVVPLAMLSELAWAPWANRYGMVSLIVAGDTGARKSSLAGLIMSAQSRSAVYNKKTEPKATAKLRHGASTAIGIDRALYPLAGMVGLADDAFATKATPQEYGAQWRTLSLIGDNTATQSGSAKGNKEVGSLRPEEYPRACLLVTAERLPGEADHGSEVARYVALELRRVDLEVLSELQAPALTRARSRAHAAMIQHGLSDLDAPARALAWAESQVESWGPHGHGRARVGYMTLLAGAYLLGQAHERAGLGSAAGFLGEFAEPLLRGACEAQARRAGVMGGRPVSSDPVTVFCRALRGMFGAQEAWAAEAGCSGPQHAPPALEQLGGPLAVGWRQGAVADDSAPTSAADLTGGPRAIWFPGRGLPVGGVSEHKGAGRRPASGFRAELYVEKARWDDVHRQVNEYAQRALGWSLPGPDELLGRLTAARIAAGAEPGRARMFGGRPHAYTFDLASILGHEDEDQDDDDGNDGGPDGQPDDGGPRALALPLPLAESYPDSAPTVAALSETMGMDAVRALVEMGARVVSDEPAGAAPVIPLRPSQVDPESPGERQAPQAAAGASRPASAATGRPAGRGRRGFSPAFRTGSLDVDGLRLRNGAAVVPAELPDNIAGMVALMDAHELRTVYVTARAAKAMGLERPLSAKGGPDAGYPHPWAVAPEGSGLSVDPDGVAPWMTVRRDGAHSRTIVFPGWETRTGMRRGRVTGFGGAEDGAALLDAVTLFAEATGFDYYRSPNKTAEGIVKAHSTYDATCHAVRAGEVPPLDVFELAVDTAWDRALTPAEDALSTVHRYDRNAAWLHAWSTPLGVGEPERWTAKDGEALTYDRDAVGWWRASEAPTGLDPLLPAIEFTAAAEGGVWISTPTMELLREIAPEWRPELVEAYVWPETHRALDSTCRVLREARRTILAAAAAGRPGARYAKAVHGSLYKSFTGYLARTAGPRKDRATGEAWAGDTLWRPDWRFLIIETANANLYRQLRGLALTSDRYPLSVSTDAVTYASDNPDPIEGRPAGMAIGDGGKEWKCEGSAPLDAIREHAPGDVNGALSDYLEREGE